MAEITCCTGQTECNHLITIGYLKSFIGTNIKDSAGATVYVNTSKSDSYVPTYSELTSGTLIPLFVDGGTNQWHSNVDGITVNGTYAANQGVEQNDLVLTYTRFKSLNISAGKTTFDGCGDNTDICATYKLTKTVKAMNNCVAAESSLEGSDTTCKPTFSSTCNWLTIGTCANNCVNVVASKNGTWSADSRTCNIISKVTYNGEEKSSNTIQITQEGITGSYSVYEGRHYTNTTITSHSPLIQTICDTLEVTAEATATYYDRYKWQDSCGTIYEYNYNDVYGTESAGSESYTFPEVLCPTSSKTTTHEVEITYQGYSDSVTFTQVCEQSCTACNDYATYGSCTTSASTDECGGDVTVSCQMPTTIHHMGWVDGECVETGTTQTSYTQSAVVHVGENATSAATSYTDSVVTLEGGTINYTIYQAAGPCGGCGEAITTYTYADIGVNCDAHTNDEKTLPYSSYTTYTVAACAPTSAEGSTNVIVSGIPCNSTSSVKTYTYTGPFGGEYHVIQAAGPCAGCEDCTKFNIQLNEAKKSVGTTASGCIYSDSAHTVAVTCATISSDTYNPENSITFELSSGISAATWSQNGNNYDVIPYFYPVQDNQEDYVIFKVNGEECSRWKCFRVCPCAIDDCMSIMESGITIDNNSIADPWKKACSHKGANGKCDEWKWTAITASGYVGTQRITDYHWDVIYINSDVVYVPYSALSVQNSAGTYVQLSPSIYLEDGLGNTAPYSGSGSFFEITSEGVIVTYNSTTNQIQYYIPNNFDPICKHYYVNYSVTDPEHNRMSGGDFVGQVPCEHFTVHIQQAPNGAHYQKSGKRSEYGEVMRYLVPLSYAEGEDFAIFDNNHISYNWGVSCMSESIDDAVRPPFECEIPLEYRISGGTCPS